MKKLTKGQFLTLSFTILGIIAFVWAILWDVKLPGDTIGSRGLEFSAFHVVFNIIVVCSWITLLVTLLTTFDSSVALYKQFYLSENEKKWDDETETSSVKINYKKWIVWSLIVIFGFMLYGWGKTLVVQSAKMYNKSKMYHNTYIQRVQEKNGFYDKLWKTYLQKEKITNINKETFLQVTKIIMENRKDGQTLTWKWVQENQQIPFSEFTKFYADLSDFISTQREGYFKIETDCQLIANMNNTLLDTFPNNIYNKVIGCDKIKFEYGFLSDSTNQVFKSKKENVK